MAEAQTSAATPAYTSAAAVPGVNNYGIPDPENANLTALTLQQLVCYATQSTNEYNGGLGARVSSIFVIGIISSCATFFPVIARRVPRLHIPLYVYLFARYFGSGVIVATAFIHLLDPAYGEIGPQTCVGLSGNWAVYSWPPAIVLGSVMGIFLLDFAAERYVETKYGAAPEENMEDVVTGANRPGAPAERVISSNSNNRRASSGHMLRAQAASGGHQDRASRGYLGPDGTIADPQQPSMATVEAGAEEKYAKKFQEDDASISNWDDEEARQFAVRQQLAAFLILEFGVIFHSVIIGLNLGVAGEEFSTLYVVLVFHQSFEGLGIGARMSAIPFAKGSWLPWALCALYGLTTPISIAIGLGLRTTYNSGSFTANVVSGVLDSVSAGILIYTGLVELLARDFLFNPLRTKNSFRLGFMMTCVFLGAGLMALLGKWA